MDIDEDIQAAEFDDLDPDQQAALFLREALEALHGRKPNDRSAKDRRYAVTITELEKVVAYFDYFVMREQE